MASRKGSVERLKHLLNQLNVKSVAVGGGSAIQSQRGDIR